MREKKNSILKYR